MENAGVHSGDATLITPPKDLNQTTLDRIRDITCRIAAALEVSGPFNMQLIAKDNELKVIECNLRVSRSFPFVSKTLDFDFVALATKVMVGHEDLEPVDVLGGTGKFGVKVPQFSFSRLAGADVTLGVEMSSTGEVACFGDHPYEAYLKAMMSSGFKLPVPPKNILLSIGAYKHKDEMKESVRLLAKMGYTLFGSWGTADYFNEIFKDEKIHIQNVQWHYENIGEGGEIEELAESVVSMTDYLSTQKFDLVINLPRNSKGGRRVSSFIPSYGHQARRMAIGQVSH